MSFLVCDVFIALTFQSFRSRVSGVVKKKGHGEVRGWRGSTSHRCFQVMMEDGSEIRRDQNHLGMHQKVHRNAGILTT